MLFRSDIHSRAFANGIKAFKHLDRTCVVGATTCSAFSALGFRLSQWARPPYPSQMAPIGSPASYPRGFLQGRYPEKAPGERSERLTPKTSKPLLLNRRCREARAPLLRSSHPFARREHLGPLPAAHSPRNHRAQARIGSDRESGEFG